MNRIPRFLTASVISLGMFAVGTAALAAPKAHHQHGGKELLGNKIKNNGHHVLHKNGPHTVSVEVKDGKIAGVHVKHATKGDVPVKKYRTNKKMAEADRFHYASLQLAQAESLGTVWIGYAYYDDYGDEVIYWFPYEMILDGYTGAVEYIPLV